MKSSWLYTTASPCFCISLFLYFPIYVFLYFSTAVGFDMKSFWLSLSPYFCISPQQLGLIRRAFDFPYLCISVFLHNSWTWYDELLTFLSSTHSLRKQRSDFFRILLIVQLVLQPLQDFLLQLTIFFRESSISCDRSPYVKMCFWRSPLFSSTLPKARAKATTYQSAPAIDIFALQYR